MKGQNSFNSPGGSGAKRRVIFGKFGLKSQRNPALTSSPLVNKDCLGRTYGRAHSGTKTMAIDLKIEPQPAYLLMTFEGQFESSVIDPITTQAVEACEKYQPSKMLFDFRQVDGQMSTMDRYNTASIFAKKYLDLKITGKIPDCRFAFVGNHPLIDPQKFGETVANNRGLNVKVFIEWTEAVAWLEANPDGE
jgi:hypothetical protein